MSNKKKKEIQLYYQPFTSNYISFPMEISSSSKRIFKDYADAKSTIDHFKNDGWGLDLSFLFSDFVNSYFGTKDLFLELASYYVNSVYNKVGIELVLSFEGNKFIIHPKEVVVYDIIYDKVEVIKYSYYKQYKTKFCLLGTL